MDLTYRTLTIEGFMEDLYIAERMYDQILEKDKTADDFDLEDFADKLEILHSFLIKYIGVRIYSDSLIYKIFKMFEFTVKYRKSELVIVVETAEEIDKECKSIKIVPMHRRVEENSENEEIIDDKNEDEDSTENEDNKKNIKPIAKKAIKDKAKTKVESEVKNKAKTKTEPKTAPKLELKTKGTEETKGTKGTRGRPKSK